MPLYLGHNLVSGQTRPVEDELREGSKNLATNDAIMKFIARKIAEIPTPDVSGQIAAHDTGTNTHADIRSAISAVQTLASSKTTMTEVNKAIDNLSDNVVHLDADNHCQGVGFVYAEPDGTFTTSIEPGSITFRGKNGEGVNIVGRSEGELSAILELYGTEDDEPVLIRGVEAPTWELDAVNKKYVDGAIASAVADKAASSHNHSASNITSGILAVERGGTGNSSVDTTPTSGSTKMVTSGGIYTYVNSVLESQVSAVLSKSY